MSYSLSAFSIAKNVGLTCVKTEGSVFHTGDLANVCVQFDHPKESESVACPFFMPTGKWEDGGWLHPARLPLGGGWSGHCSAPGHEGNQPTSDEMREFCNLGYATNCPRLPRDRSADAVRFGVVHDRGSTLNVRYVFECAHRPVEHGMLEHDLALGRWTTTHPEAQIQRMAECFLQSYLRRRSLSAPAGLNASESHDTE